MTSSNARGGELIIPDHVQILGETGHFYTVVAVEEAETSDDKRIAVEEEGEEQEEEQEDVLLCGKCKSQFSDIQLFIQHKKQSCSAKKPRRAEAAGVESEQEVYITVESSPFSPLADKSKLEQTKAQSVKREGGEGETEEAEGGEREEEEEEEVYFSVLCENSSLGQLYIDNTSLLPLAVEQTEISLLQPPAKKQKTDSEGQGGVKTTKTPPVVEEKVKKLFCSYCQKGFNKNFDLAQHVRSHTGERPYQCVICGRGFAQKSNVKKHMTTHKVWPLGHKTLPASGPSLVQSQATSDSVRTLNTKESLSADSQQVTLSVSTSYQCQYCSESFQKYPEFKTHIKIHESEKNYKCTVRSCGKLFTDLDLFLEHTSLHENKEYRCHICSKLFKDLNQLNLHSYTHLTDEQTREKQFFQCSKCKNKYSSMEALDHHLDTASHSFPCDQCDKEFASERLFRKHLAVTHTEGMFQCNICKKRMKNEHYLKSHMMIHTGELPFQCKECGAKFNRNDKLKRHSFIHSDVKKYKCPFKDHMGCSKEFHRFDKLKLHIMTHGNIKPFKCEICDNGFSRKEHLNAHMLKIHQGGKQTTTVTDPLTKLKGRQLKKTEDSVDANSNADQYKLPDRVADPLGFVSKSPESFSSSSCHSPTPGETGTDPESLQSAVGSAMEILYSSETHG